MTVQPYLNHRTILPALILALLTLLTLNTSLFAQEDKNPKDGPHESSPVTFAVDESLTPIKGDFLKLEDGESYPVASLTDDSGHQTDFLADTLWVATADPKVLDAFLQRWDGKVLADAKAAGEKDGLKRYRVRINPELAEVEHLTKYADHLAGSGHYRVSSKAGLQLLAAMTGELARGEVAVAVQWVDSDDAVTPKTIAGLKPLQTALKINCGYALMTHLRLLRDIVEGGPRGQLAEQQLGGIVADMSDCAPPTPTFDLSANGPLVLPAADAGEPLGPYILNPPSDVPQGFQAEIINAVGSFTSYSLYGGSVRLTSNGQQLGIATQPTFDLPRCARSETFTVRLSHGGNQWDFTVIQPVKLSIPGNHTYSLVPGSNVNIQLCAAGEPGAMNWQWIADSGDPFPANGMSTVQEDAVGNASITGIANETNYLTRGRLQVQQNGTSVSAPASIRIRPDFYEELEPCPPVAYLAPGEAFHCELPRPIGYESYTWSHLAGTLPPGLHLVPRNIRWYVEGTVAQATTTSTPVGEYAATFRLQGNSLTLGSQELLFNIGVPFNAWSQNMIMRPNNPFVPNTGDDNEERTDMLVSRINAGTYDIIGLQEFFDDDQRDQLALGLDWQQYDLLWGPTDERGLFGEESGVGLVINDNLGGSGGAIPNGQNGHYTEKFDDCEGTFADCLAYKGFSVTQVYLNPTDYIFVVNTHLQAGYDFPEQHASVRISQLTQIMDYLSDPVFASHPVLFLGDLNIAAGNNEYNQRRNDLLQGWQDVTTLAAGVNGPAQPFTNDKRTNAYGHFWSSHDVPGPLDVPHTMIHALEEIARSQGVSACTALLSAWNLPTSVCNFTFPHPGDQNRLDYILIRQGNQFRLTVQGVEMIDTSPTTALCRNDFYLRAHGGMNCYFSDHYGLAANLRLERTPVPGHLGLDREPAERIYLPVVLR